MKIAVYPGSFDPVTHGHIDIIERALRIFDNVIVAVLENSQKKPLFSVDERAEMIKESTKKLRIEVDTFSGLLVEYLKKKKINFVVRGMRAMSDFDHEFQMAITNKKLHPDMETVFIVTDKKYFYLNSTTVKELAKNRVDISDFVPMCVEDALRRKFV